LALGYPGGEGHHPDPVDDALMVRLQAGDGDALGELAG
jgi:hypothetical protein